MVNVQPAEEQDELDDMAWYKKDDQQYRTREVRALSDAAYRLYDQGTSFCNDQLTDGVILRDDLEMVKVGIKSSRLADHAEELCIQGLWHKPGDACTSTACPVTQGVRFTEGWVVHDYFELRPTRVEVLDRQAKYQERAVKAGLASGASRRASRTQTPTTDELSSSRQVAPQVATKNELETEAEGEIEAELNEQSVLTNAADVASPAQLVFQAWTATLPADSVVNIRLTPKRKARVSARLREGYTLADLLDAVRGWPSDSWAERALAHNRDMEVLLRDGGQVEKFAALYRQRGNPRPHVVTNGSGRSPTRAEQVDAEAAAIWSKRQEEAT